MNRLTEKVKDIVDVRASSSVTDFLADPAATLGSYHFTDITSDLMAKWIDRVADTKSGNGSALALAGFRGVGKSHFLGVLGAILSQPELRSRIHDSHVLATAQRLSRQHGPVGFVRRGSGDTLVEELKAAIALTTGVNIVDLGNSLTDLMQFASSKATDLPFVLLIDTASDRESHVARDDGAILSEVAEAAKANGVFIGLALDDDIAGADGMNSSIASSYAIDFLDQEHLYKIVNAYVFSKREQMRPVLHDIYESYRASFPGFRWSEHRFLSVYPLHPAILEIAPFVRLYLHDFALLGFASEAGLKILGRPANSLIGLDEVFDRVEGQLRMVNDLRGAFAAYDDLDRSLIAQMPLMKRHEAKLILKGLFLLSFNDETIDAKDLSAAMLIADQTGAGSSEIESILQVFADALPDSISASKAEGRGTKFGFKLGSKDDLNSALASAESKLSNDVIQSVLRRQTAEKFSDFVLGEGETSQAFETRFAWRGGIRRGEVVWTVSDSEQVEPCKNSVDWTLFITSAEQSTELPARNDSQTTYQWKLGHLTDDDRQVIRRFYLLQTDTAIREKFRELIPTALHVHSIAINKLWHRVFMVDGRFIAGANEMRFDEQAISCHTLSQLLTLMTGSALDNQFPSHPQFKRVLGEAEVSRLTEHLFSGSRALTPEIQDLAASFAVPLGLVREVDGAYVPLTETELAEMPVVKEIVSDQVFDGVEVIPIAEISERMRRRPYGLTVEAQHLILASLVAQRRFEFATSAGNRIHHRSLDLQIIWDDVTGIARPSDETYSNERLLSWAALITGDESIKTVSASQAKTKVPEALAAWLRSWRENAVLSRFDSLADENLNARIWRIYASVNKTYSAVENSIASLSDNGLALNVCLQNIADAFCDSEAEFEYKQKGLAILQETVESSPERDQVYRYLADCDAVGDAGIEQMKASLMETLAQRQLVATTVFDAEWRSFKAGYTSIYASRHDEVMAGNGRRKLDDFLSSDLWSRFAELSTVQIFGKLAMEKGLRVIRELRRLDCSADVRTILETQPTCLCGFEPSKSKDVNILIAELNVIVRQGFSDFSKRLNENSGRLANLVGSSRLSQIMYAVEDPLKLRTSDIQALKLVTKGLAPPANSQATGIHPPFESLSDLLFENEIGRLQEVADVPA